MEILTAGENGAMDEKEVITVKLADGRVTRLLVVKKILDSDNQYIVRDVGRFREPMPMTVVAN
jgi:hypothetical protein